MGTKGNESLVKHSNKHFRDNHQDTDSNSDCEHFSDSDSNWPKFIVVESSSNDLPLSKLSPFVIQKGFQAIGRTLESINRLKDRSFQVECSKKM